MERGFYCVKGPIVQSKDCTDTGGVRETKRPESGGWGVGILVPLPASHQAVGRGRED